MSGRDWSIQDIARLAGTTSRTLRHYDEIGLLPPTRIAANGYRHYDAEALVRLQRILLLRELGLGLAAIAELLGADQSGDASAASALETHLGLLRAEQTRLARQIASVQNTIASLRKGGALMPESMFDGFDHTRYKDEVETRWGTEAYADGDRWWRELSEDDRAAWKQRVVDLGAAWMALAEDGGDPAPAEAQDVARRHVAWLTGVPGTPAHDPGADRRAYVTGLAEMYVADPRFGANYATAADRENGTTTGAIFVRDALRIYAEANLSDAVAGR